jgi:hypothetical protein
MRAIPTYIPALIAVSFAQYAIDSVVISDSSTLVKSRFGHWGGVINFALVLLLAFHHLRDGPECWSARLRRLLPVSISPRLSSVCSVMACASD